MRDYELRRGQWKNIEGEQLLHLMQDIFGETDVKGEEFITSYGAIERLSAQYLNDKKTIRIDTTMNTKVDSDVAEDTRRKYYDFLELATGFNAKERSKRVQKAAKAEAAELADDS